MPGKPTLIERLNEIACRPVGERTRGLIMEAASRLEAYEAALREIENAAIDPANEAESFRSFAARITRSVLQKFA